MSKTRNASLVQTVFGDVLRSLIPPVVVLAVHETRLLLFPSFYQADPVMHFAGGAAVAWISWMLWRRWESRGWIAERSPFLLKGLTVWGTVALIGIGWEFMELGFDTFLGTRMQFSIPETMGDLFMDLAGGLFIILFLQLARRNA